MLWGVLESKYPRFVSNHVCLFDRLHICTCICILGHWKLSICTLSNYDCICIKTCEIQNEFSKLKITNSINHYSYLHAHKYSQVKMGLLPSIYHLLSILYWWSHLLFLNCKKERIKLIDSCSLHLEFIVFFANDLLGRNLFYQRSWEGPQKTISVPRSNRIKF